MAQGSIHSFIGLRSPQPQNIKNVMKHSVSKNNEVNEDEDSMG